jgi:hypothetical protein
MHSHSFSYVSTGDDGMVRGCDCGHVESVAAPAAPASEAVKPKRVAKAAKRSGKGAK